MWTHDKSGGNERRHLITLTLFEIRPRIEIDVETYHPYTNKFYVYWDQKDNEPRPEHETEKVSRLFCAHL